MLTPRAVVASLSASIVASSTSFDRRDQPSSPSANQPATGNDNVVEYDYVVVGGGTAGLAIATRLVESGRFNVAIIEAGGYYERDNGNISSTPGYWTFGAGTDPKDTTVYNPLVDWGLVSEPMKAVDNRQIHYARGKTLGGSSARNAMYYHRPTIGTMDVWAKEVDDEGYQFRNLLPYFKKVVHHTPPTNFPGNQQDPNAWGQGGPLEVSHGNFIEPFGVAIQPTLEGLGYKPLNGFSSGELIGSGYVGFTVNPKDAHRSSSEASYLNSAKDNPKLTVLPNALAEKILFDKDKQAYAVITSKDNKTTTCKAKKEIILSAGVFQSPQLLLLSGIGPAQTLATHNIPLQVDLPGVGQNLQEHPLVSTAYSITIPTASLALNNPAILAAAQETYNVNASAPLSIPGTGLVTFEKLPPQLRASFSPEAKGALDAFPPDWPEIEMIAVNAVLGYNLNYQKEDPLDGKNYASIASSLVAPVSRGSVTLASSDPASPPKIDLNFLDHPADREVAIASIKRQRELWAAFGPNITIEEFLPGKHVQSDEEIFKFVKDSVAPTWHASATCKMGKKGDKLAVVDSEAKVFGVKGLRVVDASAFPFAMPGHPQATIYAFAEKIADEILRGKRKV